MLELMTRAGDGKTGNWVIATSQLSCGLNILQGWSEGIGIDGSGNKTNWDERWFALLYYSSNTNKFGPQVWGTKSLEGPTEANISVSRRRSQFLYPGQNYVVSSKKEWIARLGKFIADHNLGDFTTTGIVENPNYGDHEIQVGLWKWNGNVPTGGKFDELRKQIEAPAVKQVTPADNAFGVKAA